MILVTAEPVLFEGWPKLLNGTNPEKEKTMRLRNSTVWRRGKTVGEYTKEPDAKPKVIPDEDNHTIELEFTIPSKGGGQVVANLTVHRKDFPVLFEAMLQAA